MPDSDANPDAEAPAGEQEAGATGSGALERRRVRPEVRAALALEDAGELEEAARIFEYAGEHGQAAALRLEYANTQRSADLRLAVLREAAARNRGPSPEGAALHRALAESLLRKATELSGSMRRSVTVEAADALAEAGEHTHAGELYERLGLLPRAARAYECAGAVSRLELVLEVLERQEKEQARVVELEREVDDAWRAGDRRHAHALLTAHVRDREALERAASPALARRLAALESRLVVGRRLDLSCDGSMLRVRCGRRLVVGRAPDAHLLVPTAGVSRHHVELRLDTNAARPTLVAMDMGTRSGTFWDGEALEPGEPMALRGSGRLALGATDELEVTEIPGPSGGALGAALRVAGARDWTLFLPGGGGLRTPTLDLRARLELGPRFPTLVAQEDVAITLAGEALGRGRRVDLLVGDRLRVGAHELEVSA